MCIMKRILVYILAFTLSVACGVSYAQSTKGSSKAFAAGETLRYVAEYKIGLFNVDVATVDLTTEETMFGSEPCYKISAVAMILAQYKWFFDMVDKYTIYMNKETLRPVYFENDIKEGSYTLTSNFKYDWDSMLVTTTEERPKWKEPKVRELELEENTFDAVSLFYNLRNVSKEKLQVGVVDTLHVVFANRVRTVAYRYLGAEVKRISGLGKMHTLKFKCQLADDEGISFEDGSEFTLWLSDDENKIPLFVDTPIRVGSVRARLIQYDGLREPLERRR